MSIVKSSQIKWSTYALAYTKYPPIYLFFFHPHQKNPFFLINPAFYFFNNAPFIGAHTLPKNNNQPAKKNKNGMCSKACKEQLGVRFSRNSMTVLNIYSSTMQPYTSLHVPLPYFKQCSLDNLSIPNHTPYQRVVSLFVNCSPVLFDDWILLQLQSKKIINMSTEKKSCLLIMHTTIWHCCLKN